MRTETVRFGVVVWQSDTAQSYQCPHCLRSVRTQYDGPEYATAIICNGPLADHVVQWATLAPLPQEGPT